MKLDIRVLVSAVIFFVGYLFFDCTDVQAQNDIDDFRDKFKNEYFSIGALLQTEGEYQFDRLAGMDANNGFSLGNARVQFFGEFDQSFGYQLQANFIRNPAVLDANMYYNFSPTSQIKAGLFKSPFSGEFLRGAAALDFVNRATVVNQLAPNRQIGVQLGGNLSEGKFRYRAGIFNGNGFDVNQNNDDQFLYVGRVESHADIDEESKMIVGINGSYEQKERAATSGNIRSVFEGEQVLAGSDIRFTRKGLMLNTEFIYAWLESNFGFQSNPYGYQATAGYFVTSQTQLLLRWDSFQSDNVSTVADSEALLAGFNYFPSSFTKIQLNYIYPTNQKVKFSQVLLNLQISL